MAAFHSQGHSSNLDPLVFFVGERLIPQLNIKLKLMLWNVKQAWSHIFWQRIPINVLFRFFDVPFPLISSRPILRHVLDHQWFFLACLRLLLLSGSKRNLGTASSG